jgi:hypothetical protein
MPKTIAIITENTRLTRIEDETDEVNNNAADAVHQNVAKATHEDDFSNVNFIPFGKPANIAHFTIIQQKTKEKKHYTTHLN